MKGWALYPGEHVYSGIIRYRYRMAQMYMSEKRFFAFNQLSYQWFRAQAPLSETMKDTLDVLEPDTHKQFALRLSHTPFAPWLLSLPPGMDAMALRDAGLRPNMEENPFQLDRRWKYCPVCCDEQRQTYGVSFWLADAQLPGVLLCQHHNTPLHSHDELRYLDFTLPHHWCSKSEALAIVHPWQSDWQVFINTLCAHLQREHYWGIGLADQIKNHLRLPLQPKKSAKGPFNDAFEHMREALGETCLSGLFTAFAKDYQHPSNVLWITLTPWGHAQGLRHPLYWLAILFWLRDSLPAQQRINENRNAPAL